MINKLTDDAGSVLLGFVDFLELVRLESGKRLRAGTELRELDAPQVLRDD
ncbi:MAG: hypothetical protein OXH23_02750 [bacterium]|nr:hypothetical protein [bacterium]